MDAKTWAAHRQSWYQRRDFAAFFERECAPLVLSSFLSLLSTAVPQVNIVFLVLFVSCFL
jgi:hypothetical protein